MLDELDGDHVDSIEELFDEGFIASLGSAGSGSGNTNINTNIHTCTTCFKSFPSQWNLDRHATIHSPDKDFKCALCGKIFALKDKYQQHLRRHRGDVTKHTCPECGKEYTDKSSLKHHLATHNTPRQRYKCPICNLSYTKPRTTKMHILREHLEGREGVNVNEIPLDEGVYAFF